MQSAPLVYVRLGELDGLVVNLTKHVARLPAQFATPKERIKKYCYFELMVLVYRLSAMHCPQLGCAFSRNLQADATRSQIPCSCI